MNAASRTVIAGAGIGGLTAALTLHARGIEASVIERADTLGPLGLGINLLPRAVRELSDLGLGDELSRVAVAPAAMSYYDERGTLSFANLEESRADICGLSMPSTEGNCRWSYSTRCEIVWGPMQFKPESK